jgi:superfamily II DNA or RNA helicase
MYRTRRNPKDPELEQAIEWALSAAQGMVDLGAPLEEDGIGASKTTWGTLSTYAMMGPDAPLGVHMAALNSLRVHSRTQLDRRAWEHAYNVVSHAFRKQGDTESVTIQKGTSAVFKPDVGLRIRFPYSQEWNPTHGIPKGQLKWIKIGNMNVLEISPAYYQHFAKHNAKAYPTLSNYILSHEREWKKELSPAQQDRWDNAEGAVVSTSGPLNPEGGRVGGFQYEWDKKNYRIVLTPPYGVRADILSRQGGAGASWIQDGGQWKSIIPTHTAHEFIENIKDDHPELERLEACVPVWRSVLSALTQSKEEGIAEGGRWKLISSGEPFLKFAPMDENYAGPKMAWYKQIKAKFSREDGVRVMLSDLTDDVIATIRKSAPDLATTLADKKRQWGVEPSLSRGKDDGIQWSLSIPSGELRIYIGGCGWKETESLADKVVGGSNEKDEKQPGVRYASFNEKRVQSVVSALREGYPRLAEALSRAFGGASTATDAAEVGHCAKLAALSGGPDGGAVDYKDIKDAGMRATVEAVAEELRKKLPPGLSPLPFQVIGITYAALNNYRALIADMPGLGKTIQAIGCLAKDPGELLPAIVVAPANVTYNWQDEIHKWLPKMPIIMLDTGHDRLPASTFKGVIIMSWEAMRERRDEILRFGPQCIIADEAHRAKNPKTATGKALRSLVIEPTAKEAELMPKEARIAPHVLLLTGTPIKNAVVELWALLSMINPQAWGRKAHFEKQFGAIVVHKKGKEPKPEDFDTDYQYESHVQDKENAEVRATGKLKDQLLCSMIRRQKDMALKDLPPKTRITINAPMSTSISSEYARAKGDFADWLESSIIRKLLEMGVDPKDATEEALAAVNKALKAVAIVKINHLRQIAARGKIPTAIALARRMAALGENFLIFCDHREVVHELSEAMRRAGIPFGVISGDTPPPQRKVLKDQYQAGTLRCLICTQAAKEGLTLTRGAVTIFVERFWTPADEQQAEDRAHRIGQKRPVTIAFLRAPNTIDDYMGRLVAAKRGLVDRVMGDEEAERNAVDDAQAELVSNLVSSSNTTSDRIWNKLKDRASYELQKWMGAHQEEVLAVIDRASDLDAVSEASALRDIEARLRKNPFRGVR